jgi:hypothetical protein
MRARLISFLLIALMALPAGWAAPVSFGGHSSHAHATSSSPACDTHEAHGRDNCPCCPDHGGGSMADCFSVCAVSVAAPAASLPVIESVGSIRPPAHAAVAFSSRADLPFKPPPIL